jgi:hypothetical protein
MAELPKTFTELLADKYIETAGRAERIRRGGRLSDLPPSTETSKVDVAGDLSDEQRRVRVVQAKDFLLACGAVAQNMRRKGHVPAPDIEIRSVRGLHRQYGLGWLLWEDGPPKVAAPTRGVLLGMDGRPITYAGMVKSIKCNHEGRMPLEVRRLDPVSAEEITIGQLALPEPPDVGLYVSGLVDLAADTNIPMEKILTTMHQAKHI